MPLAEWDVVALRRQIALVSQDVSLFNDSVAANVALGASVDRARVREALRAANLLEFVDGLPQGIDTVVGHNASQLSGGQRQRLAIARAIYKDAPILILDEATSALDSESERLVQQALERLMQGRTSLVIAHRLSTIERADRIVALEAGRIVEQGTPCRAARRRRAVRSAACAAIQELSMSRPYPISRYPVPALDDLPEDIRSQDPGGAGKGGLRAERVPRLRPPARRVPRLLRLPRRAAVARVGPHQGREGDDHRRHERRQPVPLLRRRPRRAAAHLREEAAGRRPGGGELPQGRHHASGRRRCSTSR